MPCAVGVVVGAWQLIFNQSLLSNGKKKTETEIEKIISLGRTTTEREKEKGQDKEIEEECLLPRRVRGLVKEKD